MSDAELLDYLHDDGWGAEARNLVRQVVAERDAWKELAEALEKRSRHTEDSPEWADAELRVQVLKERLGDA